MNAGRYDYMHAQDGGDNSHGHAHGGKSDFDHGRVRNWYGASRSRRLGRREGPAVERAHRGARFGKCA